MEHLLAHARVYLLVIVFFTSCFLGLTAGVSLPILAIRSIIITSIVAIFSHLFMKYIASVMRTVSSSEELGQDNNSVPQELNRSAGQTKNKK